MDPQSRTSNRRSPSSRRSSRQLEDGDLALEKSLELFERGVQLSRFCHSKLEEAERRVEILTERGEVKPAPAALGAEPARATGRGDGRDPPAGLARRAAPRCRRGARSLRARSDVARRRRLPRPTRTGVVAEAMRYSLFAGGKRLRPILALAAAEAVGERLGAPRRRPPPTLALPAACALELIHTYSLVHDDLPAMDDDTMRRGRPTAHVVFGEGMAILAGDALLTEAFALLAREPRRSAGVAVDELNRRKLQTVAIIADAAGAAGMVGGQAIDLEAALPGAARSTPAGCATCTCARPARSSCASALAGAIMAGATERRSAGDRPLRRRDRPRVPDRRRHPRRRRRVGRPRQDRRQGRRGRQAHLSCARTASTHRAGSPPTASTRALDGARERRPRPGSCRRSRAGSSAERIEDTPSGSTRCSSSAAWPRRANARARSSWPAACASTGSPPRRPARRSASTPRSTRRDAGSSVCRPRRTEAGARARRVRASTWPDAWRSTSAPRPAGSPMCCCSAAPRASSRSTSATGSSTGRSGAIRASTCSNASTRARSRLDDLPAGRVPFDIVTIDVSFISLRHILPVVPPLLAASGDVVALVKPQFEAGRAEVGQGRHRPRRRRAGARRRRGDRAPRMR